MFKYSLALLFVLIALPTAIAEKVQVAAGGKVKITINNVQSDQGKLVIQVFKDEDSWLEEGEHMQNIKVSIKDNLKNSSISTELELPFGEYAVYLYQDRDENNELKTNWIGIPREPVGTSNNAKGRMGPPKYKDAKFKLDQAEIALSIKLTDL